jgi:hypothetical protein
VTVEKPTAVGPTSEISSVISGKTYKFPDNDLGLRSLTLFLTDPHPHVEFEIYSHYPSNSSVTYDVLIGLDGLYRKGSPTISGYNPGHIPAAKGTWLNGQTFVIDAQDLGYGGQSKSLLSFSGERLNLRRTDAHGREVSVDGEQALN